MGSRWAADGQWTHGRWSADESQIATDGRQVGGRNAAYNVWAADAAIYVRICKNVLVYTVYAAMFGVCACNKIVLDGLCVRCLFVELRVASDIDFAQ